MANRRVFALYLRFESKLSEDKYRNSVGTSNGLKLAQSWCILVLVSILLTTSYTLSLAMHNYNHRLPAAGRIVVYDRQSDKASSNIGQSEL
jgi:hypothetical protein